jgi:hypothetical protein
VKTVYKKKKVRMGTYPTFLTIIYTNNDDRVRRDYPKHPDQKDYSDRASCYFQTYDDGEFIVVFNEKLGRLTFGVIAHEACHIADEVFEHLGEKRSVSYGYESYAYLVQFIVEQVCIFLVNVADAKVYINQKY